jgi:hypothetical protein
MAIDDERQSRGFADSQKSFEIRSISPSGLAESWARQRASREPVEVRDDSVQISDKLGDPLSIRQVARLIGCSAWTIRQRHLPQGLPCFRSGPAGKLIFYRNQVVAWILRQQKGGK